MLELLEGLLSGLLEAGFVAAGFDAVVVDVGLEDDDLAGILLDVPEPPDSVPAFPVLPAELVPVFPDKPALSVVAELPGNLLLPVLSAELVPVFPDESVPVVPELPGDPLLPGLSAVSDFPDEPITPDVSEPWPSDAAAPELCGGCVVFEWVEQAGALIKMIMASRAAANRFVFIFLTPHYHIRPFNLICQILSLVIDKNFDSVARRILNNID